MVDHPQDPPNMPEDDSGLSDRELLEKIHASWLKQNEINHRRDVTLAQIKSFQTDQQAINKRREASLAAINDELTLNRQILQRLSALWLPNTTTPNGENQPISKAVGTWSGWKLAMGFFTILGGLVIAYQILVPVLIALNNALLSARVSTH